MTILLYPVVLLLIATAPLVLKLIYFYTFDTCIIK